MELNNRWHTQTAEQAITELESRSIGLSQAEAMERALEYGLNEIQAAQPISAWRILLEQFKNILILILLGATAVSLFLGHGIESIAIAVIVLFAVLLGFFQESRAEYAIEALRKMASPTASVLRDGLEVKIATCDLVPGDVIILHTGDRIPADARLLESVNLQIEEAALTGESVPVEKQSQRLQGDELPVG